MKVDFVFSLATDGKVNSKHPNILFYCGTFYHKYKKFKTTGALPQIDDNGLQVSATQFCVDSKLKLLNRDVNTTIGVAETYSQLVGHIINVNDDSERECGEYT